MFKNQKRIGFLFKMHKKKVAIIGAGPAGLTAAYELSKRGFKVDVFEEDPLFVGGISRTVEHKGFRFDIGGHRFFSKNKDIEQWWEDILGDDFLSRPRLSRWYYRKKFFNYPIKPIQLLKVFGILDSIKIAASYIKAKLRPVTPEKTLADWCVNNFGAYLAKPFFIDYNIKLWGVHPRNLSKDFASQRVKGLSFTSALREAMKKSLGIKKGEVVKSLIDSFKYPSLGPGMMWERVRFLTEKNKGEFFLGHKVIKINHKDGKILYLETLDLLGRKKKFYADYVLSSMPLKDLVLALSPSPPQKIICAAQSLKFRDFVTVALMTNQENMPPDTWIYTHDEGMKPIRIQLFKNWSPHMVPDKKKSCIGVEYVCNEGDKLWRLSDDDLVKQAKTDISKLGFVDSQKIFDAKVVRLKNVYPVYLLDYQKNVSEIREYLESTFEKYSLQPIGRGGLHRYNNTDHSMMTAFLAMKNLAGEGDYSQWEVNADAGYHEESPSKIK